MAIQVNSPNQCVLVNKEAEAALTQYCAVVEGTSNGQADMPGGANAVSLGICLNAPALGEQAEICIFGPCTAIAGGAISAGNLVAIEDTGGRLVAVTVGETTGSQRIVGKALETVTTDGDHFTVFVGLNDYVAV